MKTFLKTMRVAVVAFAFVAMYTAPTIAQASLLDGFNLGGSTGLFDGTQSGTVSTNNSIDTSSSIDFKTCSLSTDLTQISFGGSVNLSWAAEGFTSININGETVSGDSGTLQITNITESTIFKLTATDGSNNCVQTISVTCLPPPVLECELEVLKSVNKTTAKPGDEIEYTITVKNTGTGPCTGGVKITDTLHPYVEYLSHTYTSNLTAGYGTKPVYDSTNRTLYFNGGTLDAGESGTIVWVGKVTEPAQCGDYEVTNQAKATAKELNNFLTWEYSQTVKTDIDNDCVTPVLSCDSFTANPTAVVTGNSSTLTWETTNASRVAINNGIGNVSADGSVSVTPLSSTTYILSVFDGNDQLADSCEVTVTVSDDPVPVCKFFTANPSALPYGGATTTLSWEVENATSVTISPTVGSVALVGNTNIFVDQATTFTLTAIDANGDEVSCPAPVTVADPTPFNCTDNVVFTVSDSSISEGQSVTLNWTVTDADSVSVNPGSYTGATGNETVSPTTDTTYTLTATKGDTTINCPLSVEVEPEQEVFTCENNVTFTASDYSISRGQNVDLDWNVTDADSVSISVINETSFSGSERVSPRDDTTYTLTATKGDVSIDCPVKINVSSGGGGSSSPRCDLDISDDKIMLGEEITLKWDTSRATDVTITDDRGKVIFTTEDMLDDDKDDNLDGEITLKPTRDTEYTLVAERGSRDTDCSVDVEVEGLTVLQTRNQQPLVAGIALSNVPYTGFEAGPILTLMFYLLLMAWALYVAYFLVLRNRNTTEAVVTEGPSFNPATQSMKQAEAVRPDVFPNVVASTTATVPSNLPTKATGTVGYENYFAGVEVSEKTADAVVTELENRAHNQKALLSSDAIEFFMKTTEGAVERNEALDDVIAEAKKHYPLEDGWVVVNQARMQSLCETCVVKPVTTEIPSSLPTGSGSLAEAIVTGNVVAAYQMIGNRPMFALADAAADLDSVVRSRMGTAEINSELLKTETAKLSDEQLKNMIAALTGALDGTYTDEASAVKMAIMKAVKEVA